MNASRDTDNSNANSTVNNDSLIDIVGDHSISNSAISSPLLTPFSPISSTPAISAPQMLDAFDWKRTINDTYFDLNVSFRQPSQFSGYLQRAKLLDIGVSYYHANTVHYKRSLASKQSSDGVKNSSDDSILITFPVTGSVRFTQKNRQLTSSPGQFFIELSNLPYEFYHLQQVSLYVIKVPLALLTPQMGTIERQFARSLSIDEGAGRLLVFQIRQILELIQQHQLAALEV